ncbi:MAG: hemerythrin family protein [Gallionella sp.]|nr:hemerythrin family protein [Gallionella sp.]
MSTWTKQLSIGNRILDSEHKKLHGIINQIDCSVVARNVAALSEAFELLESCLYDYFAVEENIAQAIGFDFTQHKLAHQHLLNEFQRIKGKLTAKNGMWPDEEGENYAHSLMNCLIQHITQDGKPLRIVLDTCLYDFNP